MCRVARLWTGLCLLGEADDGFGTVVPAPWDVGAVQVHAADPPVDAVPSGLGARKAGHARVASSSAAGSPITDGGFGVMQVACGGPTRWLDQAVRSASVGDSRAARSAGSRPAMAPMAMAAPIPPPQATAG